MLDSLEKAHISAQIALDKKVESVSIMDVRALSTVTEYFVLCTAGSARQLDAVRDHIDEVLRKKGCRPKHTEGGGAARKSAEQEQRWILMDCGDIVVHLMDEETSHFYQLERLWADAPTIPLPEQPNPSASSASSSAA